MSRLAPGAAGAAQLPPVPCCCRPVLLRAGSRALAGAGLGQQLLLFPEGLVQPARPRGMAQ